MPWRTINSQPWNFQFTNMHAATPRSSKTLIFLFTHTLFRPFTLIPALFRDLLDHFISSNYFFFASLRFTDSVA